MREQVRSRIGRSFAHAKELARTSLRFRVIGLIGVSTAAVMAVLAYVLVSAVTHQLVEQKISLARQDIDRVRAVVEQHIDATGGASSVQVRLNSTRAALTQLGSSGSEAQTTFEPVLVVDNLDNSVSTAPEGYRIPDELRDLVNAGWIAYQFIPIEQPQGASYNALVMGSPVDSDIPNTQVYLVVSMDNEESTLALLRGLLSAAAVVVMVLLIGIAWLATQQVIAPVRAASRTAQRLAAGHLRERMVVAGENEIAVLARSFNDMADKLSNQITQLEEYGNLQRQFTSDVSHELRTPLTTVRMAADMIMMDADSLDPRTRRAAELMSRELDRFEDLLTDLLEISRHDAGVADLSAANMDIRAPLEAAHQQVSHLAEELGVELRFELPDEPVTLEADQRRMERVLRNLLANAIDHSEGNPVTVAVAMTEDAVGVTVTDQGVGLKDGQESLVFNRFWRADPSRKRHSGGTGLGLAIAREDALLHGGTLDAVGYADIGSCFRLIVPRVPQGDISAEPIALAVPGAPVPSDDAPAPAPAVALPAQPAAPATLMATYGEPSPDGERKP